MPTKRTKGGAFEREVAVTLSKWWSGGARDDVFWRTAGSGGRATVRRKKGKATRFSSGDITFTDPIGRPLIELFNIECRWRREFRLVGVLYDVGAEADWLRHWAKVARDAKASARQPLLVIKQNRGEPTVWMTGEACAALWPDGLDGMPHISLHVTERIVRLPKKETVELSEQDVIGMTLAAFVASASRTRIEEAARERGRAREAAGEPHEPALAPDGPCGGREGHMWPGDGRGQPKRVVVNVMETPGPYRGIRNSSQVGGQTGPRRHGAAPRLNGSETR